MDKKLTLVRLSLRGEREELAQMFRDKALSAENRAHHEYQRNGDSPASRAQDAVIAAFREAASIVQKRIDEDAP